MTILENDFIRLRPLEESDFDSLYAVACDPLLWEQHPRPDRYQKDVFLLFFKDAINSKGALVIETKEGEVVGSSRFYNYDETQKMIVIGYTFINRKYWGGTMNREVKRLMLEHAFTFADKVHFHIGNENFRSSKAVEKIGARFMELAEVNGQKRRIYEIDKPTFRQKFGHY